MSWILSKEIADFMPLAEDSFKSTYPRINCYSHPGEDIIIEATVPGLTKDDLKITCTNDEKNNIDISIKYNKITKSTEEKPPYYYTREIHQSGFSRSVGISRYFCQDINLITAKVENGLLTITVPYQEYKKPNSVSKVITIE
jgi:HSP20 family molecular chaperone IbpA